jgi:hypothetical protein
MAMAGEPSGRRYHVVIGREVVSAQAYRSGLRRYLPMEPGGGGATPRVLARSSASLCCVSDSSGVRQTLREMEEPVGVSSRQIIRRPIRLRGRWLGATWHPEASQPHTRRGRAQQQPGCVAWRASYCIRWSRAIATGGADDGMRVTVRYDRVSARLWDSPVTPAGAFRGAGPAPVRSCDSGLIRRGTARCEISPSAWRIDRWHRVAVVWHT